ncbi:MAG: UDP-N-acetylmuramate dehydrogenase [bacterium]|nr:UDP-N-acetylmuramate dehydrogenase [bacterium]
MSSGRLDIQTQVELKLLTWMKVGGPADFFAEVETEGELIEAFSFAREQRIPIVYLGQGSNMIIPDEGIRGLVVRLMNDNTVFPEPADGTTVLVTAECGKILSRLIVDCKKRVISGLNNFIGIPGTVGAAVRGNIGIPIQEFGELVETVKVFDGENFRELPASECDFRYRGSRIKDEYWLVWSVRLRVPKESPTNSDELLLSRVAKQPKGSSCGSFFKNPDPKNGLVAGRLIDECGLKGLRLGGAFISEKHANFLMNDGSATATDVLSLARKVRQEVLDKKGILLQNEVLVYDQVGHLVDL